MWAIKYSNLNVYYYYYFQRENGVIEMEEKKKKKLNYFIQKKTEAISMFNGLYNSLEREHVKVEFEEITPF